MTIFNALKQNELDMIKNYVNAYGARDENKEMDCSIEHLLRFWEDAKEDYLSNLFDGNLILTKEISYKRDDSEVSDDIESKLISRWHKNPDCGDFVEAWYVLENKLFDESENRDAYWALQSLMCGRALASNRYNGVPADIPLPDGKTYRVSKNCKVSKAIGKIGRAYNLPQVEEFQISHSQFLNEKGLVGELCLSIHPLDYMTMSDNNCGWGSCMSWEDHGDYRQGTVEMMNSRCVVVAYLKSATDMNMPGSGYWNSKRWRELFIVDEDFILGIKGYPYWNRELEVSAMNWIKEICEAHKFGTYDDEVYTYDGSDHCVAIEPEKQIDFHFHTNRMYNDIYSEHSMFLSINLDNEYKETLHHFNYSGLSQCMRCGNELGGDWETEADLMCTYCDEVYRCAECGDYHPLSELYEVNGMYLCQWCWENCTIECSDCGQECYDSENYVGRYHFATDPKHIYEDGDLTFYLCEDCLWDGKYFDRKAIHRGRVNPWSYRYYVLPEDLTEIGLKYLGFNSVEEAKLYKAEWFVADEDYEEEFARIEVGLNDESTDIVDLDEQEKEEILFEEIKKVFYETVNNSGDNAPL